VTTADPATAPVESPPKKARTWAPRFWLGCNFFGWLRLLARNRFAIHPSLAYIAAIDTVFSVGNSGMRLLQNLFLGRPVAATKIEHPPIFVIGHWRSGTTLLHELLVLDERFTYPSSFACFAPNHFLLTEWMADPWLKFLLPSHRPMDDMTIDWDSPQEDEFALCNLGLPSPYLTLAFPNHPPQCQEYLDFEGVPQADVARWKAGLLRFLKQITWKNPKRIVLKSPPHTSRIAVLQEMFPDALFVHIVRNPYKVFVSTINMWKRMYEGQGLQKPNYEGLEEHVLRTYLRMQRQLERTRGLVDPARFYEIRYEELVRDPVSHLRRLYEHFGLGEFEQVAPKIEEYQAARADYQTKRYEMSAEERELITRHWGEFIEKYGYSIEPASV
jgi:LPS sulfotransferase NodH